MSRKLSAAVKEQRGNAEEFGALVDTRGELENAFPLEVRRSRVRWYWAWGSINIILSGYILFLLVVFWDAW